MELVIVTGMPGAGKGILADAFRAKQIPVIVMGDVIREEVQRRGMPATPANTKAVMLELRAKDGPSAVAKCCLSEFKQLESDIVVIEGCRSIDEIDVFDDYASKVTIICVHASPTTRFKRLQERGRDDDPPDWATFRERDLREISVGLGGVIALADFMIINENTLEHIQKKVQEILVRLT